MGPRERTKATQISVLRQNNFNGSDSSAKRQPDNCCVCSFLVWGEPQAFLEYRSFENQIQATQLYHPCQKAVAIPGGRL